MQLGKKWKSLQDNYIGYKKKMAGTTGQAARKFSKWSWVSHLQFLETTLTERERSPNVSNSLPPEMPLSEVPPEALLSTTPPPASVNDCTPVECTFASTSTPMQKKKRGKRNY